MRWGWEREREWQREWPWEEEGNWDSGWRTRRRLDAAPPDRVRCTLPAGHANRHQIQKRERDGLGEAHAAKVKAKERVTSEDGDEKQTPS